MANKRPPLLVASVFALLFVGRVKKEEVYKMEKIGQQASLAS